MKCDICDSPLSNISYNEDHKKYEPCSRCQEAIQDTLDGFLDTPYAPEDAFGATDPLLLTCEPVRGFQGDYEGYDDA